MSFDFSDKDKVRKSIMSVSKDMFLNDGIEKTSIRKIAKKLGIAPSTIYKYFPSKAHLLLDSIFSDYEEFVESIGIDVDSINNFTDVLNAIIEAFITFYRQQKHLNKSILREFFFIEFSTDLFEKVKGKYKILSRKQHLEDIIERAKELNILSSEVLTKDYISEIKNIEKYHMIKFVFREEMIFGEYEKDLRASLEVFFVNKLIDSKS